MRDVFHTLRTTTPGTWAGAIVLAVLIGAGCNLDPEFRAEEASASSLQDAQQQAIRELRAERVAAAIDATELKAARRCREAFPQGAALVWNHRSQAVCVPRPLP